MDDLTGKVAVVVEGAQSLGRIISKALIKEGITVHILSKDLDGAQKVIEEEMFIMDPDGKKICLAIASECQTDNISSIKLLTDLVKYHHGRLDFIIDPKDCSLVH